MEIFLDIFAGLGLFFVGVKLIGANLKQLTGRWFRGLIAAATRNVGMSSMLGILSGALTQSSNAITFISLSMVTAGLVDAGSVVPMVIWANVGTSALVLLAAVDIKLMVLFLLGATGLAFYLDLDKAPRFRHVLGAVLGLGLLFMGLELIKQGALPLRDVEAVRDFLAFAASSYVLAFLVGVILTIVAQSSATVAIVAVTMTNVGLLSIDQTIVVVIGASLGSGLSIALLTTNLTGIGRQIAWLQIAVKFAGVAVVLPWFVAETMGWVPGIKALAFALASDAQMQVALVYLVLQLVAALLTTVFRGPLMRFIADLSPPTEEEKLSKAHYLYAEAIDDAPTALDLVEREQVRLFGYLPDVIDAVRSEGTSTVSAETLVNAGTAVAQQCDDFLIEIIDNTSSREVLSDIFGLQKRNEILVGLMAAVNDYVQVVGRAGVRAEDGKFSRLLFALGESVHTILTIARDALDSRDRADLELVLSFTADRSTQMEGMRRRIMDVGDITPADHDTLYSSTTLFERILWLARRYVELADEAVANEGTAD